LVPRFAGLPEPNFKVDPFKYFRERYSGVLAVNGGLQPQQVGERATGPHGGCMRSQCAAAVLAEEGVCHGARMTLGQSLGGLDHQNNYYLRCRHREWR
jgi:hypothetical protein